MTEDQVRQILKSEGVNDATVEEFINWNQKRREVWKKFEEVALRGFRDKQMRRWGVGGIAEVVRYELFKPGGSDFVINNNYRAYYGRILVAKYPFLKGKIQFRKVRGLRQRRQKTWKEQKLWAA